MHDIFLWVTTPALQHAFVKSISNLEADLAFHSVLQHRDGSIDRHDRSQHAKHIIEGLVSTLRVFLSRLPVSASLPRFLLVSATSILTSDRDQASIAEQADHTEDRPIQLIHHAKRPHWKLKW